MDRRAINYNSSATAYDPDSQDSSKLCHGAYCVSGAAHAGAAAACDHGF
jgi:hypothetical protein